MNVGKLLAIANMSLAALACLGYLTAGDFRKAIYWGAAAVLTASVTL
jgi:hypothetical protein